MDAASVNKVLDRIRQRRVERKPIIDALRRSIEESRRADIKPTGWDDYCERRAARLKERGL